MAEDHALRHLLNDEIHGRAGHPVKAPARVVYLAYVVTESDPDPLSSISALCDFYKSIRPQDGALHYAMETPVGYFRYERHGEFYRFSIVLAKNVSEKLLSELLPEHWLENLPGNRLVAINTNVLSKSAKPPSLNFIIKYFGHEDVAASAVSQRNATIWTDFRIGKDGFTRMLVRDYGLSPIRLGRILRRLHEIETYRMMALLTLPLARELQKQIGEREKLLSATINKMLVAGSAEDDAALLTQLSSIAGDVEDMSNRSNYRFSAARAYTALVRKRVEELAEERVLNYQRIGVFLDRRFGPAMATCSAVYDRISSLAQRSERASNLLRTRVDIALEGQNQKLLKSMDTRVKQQVMLQQTVEGLSVVAISYYVVAMLTKFFEYTEKLFDVAPKYLLLISWMLIPIVVLLVWFGLRRLRRRINEY